MASNAGSLEYAQARLQARYGARPDEAAWRRLEAVRDARGAFEAAQAPAFRPWVAGLDPGAGVHALESSLRQRWRALISEVARWMPAEWQPAIDWCGVLADLPAIDHLLRGGEAYPWMRKDPVLANVAHGDGERRRTALAGSPLAPLLGPAPRSRQGSPVPLLPAWLAELRHRMPRLGGDDRRLIDACLHAVDPHRDAFARAAPDEARSLRQALRARLDALFRRAALSPAAAFVFLLGAALDVERLRGELSLRCAFPPPRSPS
ncbi:MAG: hypothetical protein HY778_14260 [Betaproteobacteria bacterium]|nr:hypothetical protein [Betaproteobacteria bacterium]